jgi:hypothetical protein
MKVEVTEAICREWGKREVGRRGLKVERQSGERQGTQQSKTRAL